MGLPRLSSSNPRVQSIRRLLRQHKFRVETGLLVLEGPGLVAEAVAAGATIRDVLVPDGVDAPADLLQDLERAGASMATVDASVFESLASTRSPQPMLATVDQPWADIPGGIRDTATFVVVAAGVREPGNAGTLVRTAAAAGADAVVFCDDPVDVGNPKVVRATAGALFHVPVVARAEVVELWERLDHLGFATVGLAGDSDRAYDELDFTGRVALVVGNEAHGLAPGVEARLSHRVAIPMARGIESLNVAAAAAVVAFEVARQRRGR